jgi:hypothetical protein
MHKLRKFDINAIWQLVSLEYWGHEETALAAPDKTELYYFVHSNLD